MRDTSAALSDSLQLRTGSNQSLSGLIAFILDKVLDKRAVAVEKFFKNVAVKEFANFRYQEELLDDDTVKDFAGTYEPEEFLLNPGRPVAVGPYSISAYAMEAKYNQKVAMENSKEVIKKVGDLNHVHKNKP